MKNRFVAITVVGLIFCIGMIIAWKMIANNQRKMDRLPVYSPADLNDSLVDVELQNKGSNHVVSDFNLIDQNGNNVTQSITKGKIYVADFFFVNCGTICPKMTSQLKRVQEKYKSNNKVVLLSHSVMPEQDSAEALQVYADMHGAIQGKWYFLTGEKKEIYRLARRSYFVVQSAKDFTEDGSPSDFIHTENFVLVDSRKRIRGYYDGTSAEDVNRLMSDMDKLLFEEANERPD